MINSAPSSAVNEDQSFLPSLSIQLTDSGKVSLRDMFEEVLSISIYVFTKLLCLVVDGYLICYNSLSSSQVDLSSIHKVAGIFFHF